MQTLRRLALPRPFHAFLPRVPLATPRSLVLVALAVLVIAAGGSPIAAQAWRARQRGVPALNAVAAPVPAYASDLGTEHDPFILQSSQRRYASLSPARDYASDYGTEFDPFVIQGSQRRYASPAMATDPASDLGTEFDPFVIENSRPRYTPVTQEGDERTSQPVP